MTQTQHDLTEAFRLQIDIRGHALLLNGEGDEVQALVETAQREQGQFLIQREVANAARVHVLRADLDEAGLVPSIGDIWHDSLSGGRYRVTGIEDQPVKVAIVFDCTIEVQ